MGMGAVMRTGMGLRPADGQLYLIFIALQLWRRLPSEIKQNSRRPAEMSKICGGNKNMNRQDKM